MREENKTIRQDQIESAAYKVLEQKGYAGTSMQSIAKQARASNETLYKWYGDKLGLYKALVTRNAAEIKSLLEAELSADRDPLAILGLLGPKLLTLLLGDRAIALNRAAAADRSGVLGVTLSQAGRESVLPLLVRVMEAAHQKGQLSFEDTEAAVGLYLDLLIGDLQIRRVIGRQAAPDQDFCTARAERATGLLQKILS
ncbi:MAG: TetR/AcrR family transcriptional regulator [Silicimonas sp.]|nr:TetR/AcrR family transcriptional regulator [Silicimonas sp.]